MKYIEEDFAKDLYRELTQRFADRTPTIACSVGGRGFYWCCAVKHGRNICYINCFGVFGSSEYSISFKRDSEIIAMGRTSEKLETINAVDDWIQGCELFVLYEKFSFIDQFKRDIMGIRDDLVASSPELSELAKLGDSYKLWFERADRRGCVSLYDDNKRIIHAAFYWDKSILFNIKTQERKCLAGVLKRWVCDRALPSEMRTEFSWIEMDEMADFYERGNPIEGEFIRSWNSIEEFYEAHRIYLGDVLTNLILELVNSMRNEGYDRHLHARQAHYLLILSRRAFSRSYLCFELGHDSYKLLEKKKNIQCLRVSYHVDGTIYEEFEEDEIAFTSRIRNLLKRLSEQPIN